MGELQVNRLVREMFLRGVSARKVQGATGVKKRLVLCTYEFSDGGQRELISFRNFHKILDATVVFRGPLIGCLRCKIAVAPGRQALRATR